MVSPSTAACPARQPGEILWWLDPHRLALTGVRHGRGVSPEIPGAPKPKRARHEHHRRDDEEGNIHARTVGNPTDQRWRERVSQSVNDENVQSERGGADRG